MILFIYHFFSPFLVRSLWFIRVCCSLTYLVTYLFVCIFYSRAHLPGKSSTFLTFSCLSSVMMVCPGLRSSLCLWQNYLWHRFGREKVSFVRIVFQHCLYLICWLTVCFFSPEKIENPTTTTTGERTRGEGDQSPSGGATKKKKWNNITFLNIVQRCGSKRIKCWGVGRRKKNIYNTKKMPVNEMESRIALPGWTIPLKRELALSLSPAGE